MRGGGRRPVYLFLARADIRNILSSTRLSGSEIVWRLEQNYRSTQNILEAASAVVANNVRRKGEESLDLAAGRREDRHYEAPDGENEALFAR